ncbi:MULTISPECIES: pentapeptide repeat-containing protein [unclassified Dolichospermum]|uniref:pentapeptide repeat-containing protein n=1 Tax=unclassified Dolichospermum TaxID=2622029 RepID=UPI001446F463|nr:MULTISPECIES: pentapeptide repeat-containing protein [unclassified Dolichospermum]
MGNDQKSFNYWLIFLSLFAALFIIVSFGTGYLIWFISPANELIKNETEVLKTVATIFGGLAVIINAFFAAQRAAAMDKSAEAALKSAEGINKNAEAALKNAEIALKNTQVAEDKQITERFSKAIEQLGSDKIEVRLGAIYTLERIAKDSEKDHWTIMEVLTAFVRQNAPIKQEEKSQDKKLLIAELLSVQKTKDIQKLPKLQLDIQESLTVIGRREHKDLEEGKELNLSNINISQANLNKAYLSGVNLSGVNLSGANLSEANLFGANLFGADLSRANLMEANLMRANFMKANLMKTNLMGANLMEANLMEANLMEANLMETNLMETNLMGANLSSVHGLESEQIASTIGDDTTILLEEIERPEHWIPF